jgi:8-amino-7-oxononanoate synthase
VTRASTSSGSCLISRWNADDLRTLWMRRIDAGDDGRVIGFWARNEHRFFPVSQHVFLRQALTLVDLLCGTGVGPDTPVVIDCTTPRATLLAYIGTVLSGGLPIINPVHLVSRMPTGERAAELYSRIGSACIVTDRQAPPRVVGAGFGHSGPPTAVIDPVGIAAADKIPRSVAGPGRPGDIAHLQLTSGSTASPKAAAVTHGNVLANCEALSQLGAMSDDDAMVSWLPLYHDMGLIGMALLSLLQGTDLHLLSPFDFLAHPGDWLAAISTTGAAVTTSPTFGFRLAATRTPDSVREGLDLSHLRIASCGGEPVRADVLTMFAERFAPCGLGPGVLQPCYGLAEATLAVTYGRGSDHGPPPLVRLTGSALVADGQVVLTDCGRLGDEPTEIVPSDLDGVTESGPLPKTQLLVSAGIPVAETEVVILDPATGEPRSAEDRTGEVAVRGPGVTPGYWEAGGVRANPNRWLRTGDIGLIHHGQLYLVERSNNLLIRNGQNYPALALESALAGACGVDVDAVMVVDCDIYDPASRLTGVLEVLHRADPAHLADTAAAAGGLLELPLDSVVVVRRGGLPRTSSGKKQHAALRQALREQALPVLASRHAGPSTRAPAPAAVDLTDQKPIVDLRPPAESPDVAAIVIDEVRRACQDRGTASRVGPDALLHHDLDLDSLALFELAVAVEERTGGAIGHDRLLTVRSVTDLIRAVGDDPSESGLQARYDRYLDSIPQLNVVVAHQNGRSLIVAGRSVADFASCNYLGLDLHPAVMDAIDPMVRAWGVHPSWTRAVASPEPYLDLERRLASLVGAADTVLFPTVSLLHLGVLPKLAGPGGALLIDESAHHSIHEAAELAGSRGTDVRLFRHGDLADLSAKLRATAPRSGRVIALDGVYSMSGAVPDLRGMLEVAEAWDATLYIDDAHGFGILGEHPSRSAPFGRRGNGVLRHVGVPMDRVVYVAGLSKAFSSMGAFVTCGGSEQRRRLVSASTLVFSGPVPTASLASALAGLDVNEREGDAIRLRLHQLTTTLVAGMRDLGLRVSNTTGFPILTVQFGSLDAVVVACRVLWDHGILVTPAVFPAVPVDQGGVRFSVTAANTDDDVARALGALAAARDSTATATRRAVVVGAGAAPASR